jgi:hypothetical protein
MFARRVPPVVGRDDDSGIRAADDSGVLPE